MILSNFFVRIYIYFACVSLCLRVYMYVRVSALRVSECTWQIITDADF